MTETVLGRAAAWAGALPAPAADAVFWGLLAIPAAAWAAGMAACLAKRGGNVRWFLYLAAGCDLSAAAFACYAFARPALPSAAAEAAFAGMLGLYGLLLLAAKKRQAKKKRRLSPEEFFGNEPPEPPALRESGAGMHCERGQAARPAQGVRLDYVLSVAERLLSLPLGAGDRLEAEKMNTLLEVYRGKEKFTAEECAALNDILAALLKMMAKYGV